MRISPLDLARFEQAKEQYKQQVCLDVDKLFDLFLTELNSQHLYEQVPLNLDIATDAALAPTQSTNGSKLSCNETQQPLDLITNEILTDTDQFCRHDNNKFVHQQKVPLDTEFEPILIRESQPSNEQNLFDTNSNDQLLQHCNVQNIPPTTDVLVQERCQQNSQQPSPFKLFPIKQEITDDHVTTEFVNDNDDDDNSEQLVGCHVHRKRPFDDISVDLHHCQCQAKCRVQQEMAANAQNDNHMLSLSNRAHDYSQVVPNNPVSYSFDDDIYDEELLREVKEEILEEQRIAPAKRPLIDASESGHIGELQIDLHTSTNDELVEINSLSSMNSVVSALDLTTVILRQTQQTITRNSQITENDSKNEQSYVGELNNSKNDERIETQNEDKCNNHFVSILNFTNETQTMIVPGSFSDVTASSFDGRNEINSQAENNKRHELKDSHTANSSTDEFVESYNESRLKKGSDANCPENKTITRSRSLLGEGRIAKSTSSSSKSNRRNFSKFSNRKHHKYLIISLNCPLSSCQLSFKTENEFDSHMAHVHNELPFLCPFPICGKQSFRTRAELSNHFGINHFDLDRSQMICIHCSHQLDGPMAVFDHMIGRHYKGQFGCVEDNCPNVDLYRVWAISHYNKKHLNNNANLQMIKVKPKKKTKKKTQMKPSPIVEADDPYTYRMISFHCTTKGCTSEVCSYESLENHSKMRHNNLVYPCVISRCGKLFSSRSDLKDHCSSSHSKAKILHCFKCRFSHKDMVSLFSHYDMNHHVGHFQCTKENCLHASKCRTDAVKHYTQEH